VVYKNIQLLLNSDLLVGKAHFRTAAARWESMG